MNIDSTMFDDIYGAWEPAWYQNPWMLGGITSAVLGLVVVGYVSYRFFTRKRSVDQLMQYQSALYRMDAQKNSLSRYEQQYAFYSLATKCVKWIIDVHYHVPMLHKTDAEALNAMDTVDISRDVTSLATEVFPAAQRVKFSCATVSPEKVAEHYQGLVGLLQKIARERSASEG